MAEQPRQRQKSTRQAVADHAPWKPVAWDEKAAGAIQAFARGEASPHQQKLAYLFIIERLAGTYEAHYYPGPEGARDTDFALGRAFVGQQLVKLTKVHIQALTTGKRGEQG